MIRKGAVIETASDLAVILEAGDAVWFGDRLWNAKAMLKLPLATLQGAVHAGSLRRIRRREWGNGSVHWRRA